MQLPCSNLGPQRPACGFEAWGSAPVKPHFNLRHFALAQAKVNPHFLYESLKQQKIHELFNLLNHACRSHAIFFYIYFASRWSWQAPS